MTTEQAVRALMGRSPVLAPGHVWLAGAGPGDPAHLTLHAVAGLAQADAVVHDALVDRRVLDLARPDAARIFAGKRGGKPSIDQADIADRLIGLARSGKRVLRLKGGDPFVFGRGGEEVLALAAAGIPFRVVPGLTSGLAALGLAHIPATMRGVNQAIVFATGYSADAESGIDWAALARLRQPIVLYMATRTLADIARALIAGGLEPGTPAAVIASAATPEERIVVSNLSDVARAMQDAQLEPPAIAVIGEIVAMRERLHGLVPGIRKSVECLLAG